MSEQWKELTDRSFATTEAISPAERKVRERVRTAGFWKRLRWRLELAAFVATMRLLKLLPIEVLVRIGRGIGAVLVLLMGTRRRYVERNLRIAFAGEKTREELKMLTREVFVRGTANVVAAFRTGTCSVEELRKIVVLENPEELEEIKRLAEHGAVSLLAHMGNWEALAQTLPLLMPQGKKLATIYRFIKNPWLNERIMSARLKMGLTLFEKHSGMLTITAFLKDGGWLGIMGDQRVARGGEKVPFFGRLTYCTATPELMARKVGCVVFGMSLKTIGTGRWALKIHRMPDGEVTTAGCMKLLEEMLRESPADVMWIQDRWRLSSGRDALKVKGEDSEQVKGWTKARRVLVWAVRLAEAPVLPEDCGEDVQWEFAVSEGEAPSWLPAKAVRRAVEKGERLERILRGIDDAEGVPLDAVLLVGTKEDEAVKQAARKLHLNVVG